MSPRPGPPTFTEQARRAQIVRAAIETVNEVGYPRSSLAEIARHAGIAKSAIMYYFSSKDALLLHVVNEVFTELAQQLQTAVANHSDPAEQLRAYVEAHLEHADHHRAELAAGVEIVLSHRDAESRPLYLSESAEDSLLLGQILHAGMESGAFVPMSTPIAIKVVEALLDLVTTELQRDLDADLTELAPEVVRAVFRFMDPRAR